MIEEFEDTVTQSLLIYLKTFCIGDQPCRPSLMKIYQSFRLDLYELL